MPEDEQKVITITLPTDAYFMSGIRDFTLTLVRNMTSMSDQWAYRFQSVVDELCNNAIEHGSAPGALVSIRFVITPNERIEVQVDDTGTGPHQLTAKELETRVEEAKELVNSPSQNIGIRGRGLAQIVSSWTNELHFEAIEGGGIRVRAIKYIDKSDDQGVTGFVSLPAGAQNSDSAFTA